MDDLISRQQAIDAIMGEYPDVHYPDWYASKIRALPSAQPYTAEEIDKMQELESAQLEKAYELGRESAQPERTCVNCGRTVNNGGWYADGGTRCPIEEHYALPKDGYCHLWEKRNVTDDNYPERREE